MVLEDLARGADCCAYLCKYLKKVVEVHGGGGDGGGRSDFMVVRITRSHTPIISLYRSSTCVKHAAAVLRLLMSTFRAVVTPVAFAATGGYSTVPTSIAHCRNTRSSGEV